LSDQDFVDVEVYNAGLSGERFFWRPSLEVIARKK